MAIEPTILATGLSVTIRQVKDVSIETDASENKFQVELPGHIEIGVEYEGVFVPLLTRKAPGLLADVARAKLAAASAAPSELATPSEPAAPAEPAPTPAAPSEQ